MTAFQHPVFSLTANSTLSFSSVAFKISHVGHSHFLSLTLEARSKPGICVTCSSRFFHSKAKLSLIQTTPLFLQLSGFSCLNGIEAIDPLTKSQPWRWNENNKQAYESILWERKKSSMVSGETSCDLVMAWGSESFLSLLFVPCPLCKTDPRVTLFIFIYSVCIWVCKCLSIKEEVRDLW